MTRTNDELDTALGGLERRLMEVERQLAALTPAPVAGPPALPALPTAAPASPKLPPLGLAAGRPADPHVLPGDLLARAFSSSGPSPMLAVGHQAGRVAAAGSAEQRDAGPPLTIDEIRRLQRGADPDTILLSNMGYVSVLMSQEYRRQAEHVRQVLAQKQGKQLALEWTGRVLRGLFITGLSAVTAGIAAELARIVAHASEYALTELTIEAGAHGMFDRAMAQPAELGIEKTSEALAFERGPEIDPLDFFLDQERRLRMLAMRVAAKELTAPAAAGERATVDRLRKAVDAARTQAVSQALGPIGTGDTRSLAELLRLPITERALATAFKELEESWLPVLMRRLIWRNYCRSQWYRSVYKYAVEVPEKVPAGLRLMDRPASQWPHTVWQQEGHAWPLHFDQICADFRGPEHDAKPAAPTATWNDGPRLQDRTWISLAVVHCCQVRRTRKDDAKGWLVDLEHPARQADQATTDYDLLFTSFGDLADRWLPAAGQESVMSAAHVLRAMRTDGRSLVRIRELRISEGMLWVFKQRQKLGIGRGGVAVAPGTPAKPCLDAIEGETVVVTLTATESSRKVNVRLLTQQLTPTPGDIIPDEVGFGDSAEQTRQLIMMEAGIYRVWLEPADSMEVPLRGATAAARRVESLAWATKKNLVITDNTEWFVRVIPKQ